MKDTLAEMRGAPVAVQLKQDIKPGPGVGTGVGVGVGAGNEPGLPARALITSNMTGGSGGINTASYSRNTGGGGLAGRATTLVDGVAGGGHSSAEARHGGRQRLGRPRGPLPSPHAVDEGGVAHPLAARRPPLSRGWISPSGRESGRHRRECGR